MTRNKFLHVSAIALTGSILIANIAMAKDGMLGKTLLCPSENGLQSVYAYIGRIDTAQDLNRSGANMTKPVFGVQLFALPSNLYQKVGHSPFSEAALSGCEFVNDDSFDFDQQWFAEGYGAWREAFDKGEAGVWDIDLAAAYWATIGVVN